MTLLKMEFVGKYTMDEGMIDFVGRNGCSAQRCGFCRPDRAWCPYANFKDCTIRPWRIVDEDSLEHAIELLIALVQ